jgi:ATP/maltotriose-dependent transcriptional regulator MalT
LQRSQELPLPPLQLLALACFAGYACWWHHDHRLATEWVERGLAAAMATGSAGARLRIDLTTVQALIQTDLGQMDEAERSARLAVQQATSMGYGSGRQSALVALGRVHERQGSADEAIARFTEALAQPEGLDLPSLRVRWLLDRAHALLESGRLGAAGADVDRAEAEARRCGDRVSLLRVGITRGLLHLARRRTTEAERAFTQARQLASRLGERQLEGRCYVALAAVHAHRGELAPARELLARGVAEENEVPVHHPLERVVAAELAVLDGPWETHVAMRDRHLGA